MIDRANGVPPLFSDLEGCWGCGGCFTLRSSSGERREGGHSDQDKHRLRPVGRISIHLEGAYISPRPETP